MSRSEKSFKILTSYYRPKPGGLCKRLFRLINSLLDEGHEVHYLSVVNFPIEHEKCYFHRFPWPEKYIETWLFWVLFHLGAPFFLLFIGLKYKVTHSFAFSTNYAFLLQPLCKLKCIPLSLFLRADAIKNHSIKKRNNLLLIIEKGLEAFAIHKINVFGVSQQLVDDVTSRHSYFKPSKVGVVRNDIVINTKVNRKFKRKPINMVCVGLLENRKNQKLLLSCMQHISKDDALLYIYGEGPKEQELKNLVFKMNISDKVMFMGWVDSSTIWENSDLLLQPSMHEGAPNSVLEALANYVPTLASDIPEHQEILPNSSLVSIESSQHWLDKINDILIDSESSLANLLDDQIPYAKKLCFDWEFEMSRKIITNV